MNIRNLLVALLVILTQLHTSVAQTPTPPDARIGPPQFEHGTKLMYSSFDMKDIPDGSILKWMTFYYTCNSALITRTSTVGVPFVLTMTLYAFPYEGEQYLIPTGSQPTEYYYSIPGFEIYTKTTSLFIADRRIRSFVSDEMTVTLDLYKYAYSFVFDGASPPNTPDSSRGSCDSINRVFPPIFTGVRLAYFPSIVGINAFLPNVNR